MNGTDESGEAYEAHETDETNETVPRPQWMHADTTQSPTRRRHRHTVQDATTSNPDEYTVDVTDGRENLFFGGTHAGGRDHEKNDFIFSVEDGFSLSTPRERTPIQPNHKTVAVLANQQNNSSTNYYYYYYYYWYRGDTNTYNEFLQKTRLVSQRYHGFGEEVMA